MLTKVVIPSSVKFIGDFAFDQCQSLTDVIIESSDVEIGKDAFPQQTKITK